MNKVDFYDEITNEQGVIMAFSKIHDQLGFPKLVPTSNRGFDIENIEYKGEEVTLEFEYLSSNYLIHGHQDNMIPNKKYVVVCWKDDCSLMTKIIQEYGKKLFEVIEISKFVTIKKDKNINSNQVEEPKYIVLSYNPKNAEGKDFSEWINSNCFRVTTSPTNPKFAKDKLPAGSKILFYQKGYIIGGCTVVRYEVIDEPQTDVEWQLYKKLTDYPITLFTYDINYLKNNFQRGHIFYTDFFISKFRIKLSNYVSKQMSRQGMMTITREQYYEIVGR